MLKLKKAKFIDKYQNFYVVHPHNLHYSGLQSGLVNTKNYLEKQILLGISQLLTCLMIGPIAIYKQILQKKLNLQNQTKQQTDLRVNNWIEYLLAGFFI